jgi:hypothetical protein
VPDKDRLKVPSRSRFHSAPARRHREIARHANIAATRNHRQGENEMTNTYGCCQRQDGRSTTRNGHRIDDALSEIEQGDRRQKFPVSGVTCIPSLRTTRHLIWLICEVNGNAKSRPLSNLPVRLSAAERFCCRQAPTDMQEPRAGQILHSHPAIACTARHRTQDNVASAYPIQGEVMFWPIFARLARR